MKTADRLGYKAGKLNSKVNLVEMELCRLSGRRATAGCREAKTAYIDQVPADIALPENDLCPLHPAKRPGRRRVHHSPTPTPPAPCPSTESAPLRSPARRGTRRTQAIPLEDHSLVKSHNLRSQITHPCPPGVPSTPSVLEALASRVAARAGAAAFPALGDRPRRSIRIRVFLLHARDALRHGRSRQAPRRHHVL